MKHITEEYGQECNRLELTENEYKNLEPFLISLGVRSRFVCCYYKDKTLMYEIQAENPYKNILARHSFYNEGIKRDFDIANKDMEPASMAHYKR